MGDVCYLVIVIHRLHADLHSEKIAIISMCVCVRVCVHVCVLAYMRACVHACVRAVPVAILTT